MTLEQGVANHYKPDFCMAYGSAVFQQQNYNGNVVDFLFGINDSRQWHKENMQTNRDDYSGPALSFGPNFVTFAQDLGTGVYYHPFINFKGQVIKYGTTSSRNLINDLVNWDSLFSAGRLHKPVKIVKSTSSIDDAIQKNRAHALNVALLLLDEHFTEEELYTTIASISYMGDSRMWFAENRDKVKNIVLPNMEEFHDIYHDIVKDDVHIATDIQQDKSPEKEQERYSNLPTTIKRVIHSNNPQELMAAIKHTVLWSSIGIAIKGLISAGPTYSAIYLIGKMKKSRLKQPK